MHFEPEGYTLYLLYKQNHHVSLYSLNPTNLAAYFVESNLLANISGNETELSRDICLSEVVLIQGVSFIFPICFDHIFSKTAPFLAILVLFQSSRDVILYARNPN